jgi:hypothetical protein
MPSKAEQTQILLEVQSDELSGRRDFVSKPESMVRLLLDVIFVMTITSSASNEGFR